MVFPLQRHAFQSHDIDVLPALKNVHSYASFQFHTA